MSTKLQQHSDGRCQPLLSPPESLFRSAFYCMSNQRQLPYKRIGVYYYSDLQCDLHITLFEGIDVY